MSQFSPTLQWRRIGMELRQLRRAAGMTTDDVYKALEISQPKLNRIEKGRQEIPQRDLIAMLTTYGAPDRIMELTELRRVARQPGWWQQYGEGLGSFVDFEGGASLIKSHDPLLIPGLLQTEDYAREVIPAHIPDADGDEIGRKVEMRVRRSTLLDEKPGPRLWAIVGEAALRTEVGSKKLMVKQLLHLLAMFDHPRVTIQLLPFQAGAHPGMDGGFVLLEYADIEDSDVAYMDRPAGSIWVERPAEVGRIRVAFEHLQAAATPVGESAEAIRKIVTEMQDERVDVAEVES